MSNSDPKQMAKRLRTELAERGLEVTHGQALELVAHQHGHADWNTMSALRALPPPAPEGSPERSPSAIPIFRMFDVERTLDFYVGFLGFRLAWEHRFEEGMPLYLEVERERVRLHLSEHHGDATPGSAAIIHVEDAVALQRELAAKEYRYARPALERQDWGLSVTVGDPAGNRLIFLEQ